jgi:MoaA/NifB/PqqE/SkfB family radical SAM enzyme
MQNKQIDLRDLLRQDKAVPFFVERRHLDRLKLPPIAVELHWTSDCNYDCVHCSYGSRRETRGRLSDLQIDGLVNDLINLKAEAVYISGGGEPTVVKGWDRYASKLIDGGVQVGLITNGVALRQEHLHALTRMNYVAVSIYSDDPEQYAKITDSRFYDVQWKSPELIKSKGGDVIVGARCVINKINYKNIVQIYNRAVSSGYDYVIFIPAVDYEGRGVDLSRIEQNEVLDIIDSNIALFPEDKTNLSSVLSKGVWHYEQKSYLEGNDVSSGCHAIDLRFNAFVNYCGGIWLCQPHIGNSRYSIGNLNNQRFSEIWNLPGHGSVIDILHRDYRAGFCKNCRSIGFNKKIGESGYNSVTGVLERDPFV